jgi:hypothetical protein
MDYKIAFLRYGITAARNASFPRNFVTRASLSVIRGAAGTQDRCQPARSLEIHPAQAQPRTCPLTAPAPASACTPGGQPYCGGFAEPGLAEEIVGHTEMSGFFTPAAENTSIASPP